MQTSNFSKAGKHPNAVSIARSNPGWYTGKTYLPLAPTWEMIGYAKAGNTELYTKMYNKILEKLNPIDTYNYLDEESILLCYESSKDFCHRHLVREWFNNHGLNVTEMI